MKIIKADKQGIATAIRLLKKGGVIVYPTDTAYALGGVYSNPLVAKKILAIKKRRDPKFTLVASDQKQVERFFKLSAAQKKFVAAFWPGPLTLVVSKRFSVRVPASEIARSLAAGANAPLIATSANISGKKTPYSIATIVKQFDDSVDVLVLDAGRLTYKKTSTIVSVDSKGVTVIRPGAVTDSRLRRYEP